MTQSQVKELISGHLESLVKNVDRIETIMVLKHARQMLKTLMNQQIPDSDHSVYLGTIDDLLKRLEQKEQL